MKGVELIHAASISGRVRDKVIDFSGYSLLSFIIQMKAIKAVFHVIRLE